MTAEQQTDSTQLELNFAPELIARLEALLFISPEGLSAPQLADSLDLTPGQAKKALAQLSAELERPERGLELKKINNRYTLTNKKRYGSFIQETLAAPRQVKLTEASLETLAIVAYHQPVTRTEIEEIRGVRVDQTLRTLSKYDLIAELGRREQPGNPIEYGTTEEFLYHFDLADLEALPDRRSLAEPDQNEQEELNQEVNQKETHPPEEEN